MLLDKFVASYSGRLNDAGRFRMYTAHQSVLNSVSEFCGNAIPPLKTVYTKDFLRRYEDYLIYKGCMRNTISFYMTVLRSIYGIAVAAGKIQIIPQLFADVFTGSDPTEKRAIDSDVIALLYATDLSESPRLERCRDIFILSFYLQGMAFVDLAYLRKSDIQGDIVTYRRRKSGSLVCVSMLEPAKQILTKYEDEVEDSPYAFPLITLSGADAHRQRQSALRRHNRQLKALAAHLGIKDNLTSYVARHSWATMAHHNGVDVSVVSQAMGHHTEEITRVYLSSFAQAKLTEANHIVLKAVLRPIQEGLIKQVRKEVEFELRREVSGSTYDLKDDSLRNQHRTDRSKFGGKRKREEKAEQRLRNKKCPSSRT